MSELHDVDRARLYKARIDIDVENSSHSKIFKFIPDGSNVLDVGCACGDLGEVLHKVKNCKVWGLEGYAESAAIARGLGVYESVDIVDLNSFPAAQFENYKGKFDCIVFGDVLEHLLAPEKVVALFREYLAPDGRFIVSLPNVAHASIKCKLLEDRWEYNNLGILDRTHLRFYTYKSIAATMAEWLLEIETASYAASGKNGCPADANWKAIPFFTRLFIYNNPHSFVFQYVFEARPAAKGVAELVAVNLAKLRIGSDNIPSELKKRMRRSSQLIRARMFLSDIWNFVFGRRHL